MLLGHGKFERDFVLKSTEEAANQIIDFANRLSSNVLITGKPLTGKTLLCNAITNQYMSFYPDNINKPFEFDVNLENKKTNFVALDETFSFSEELEKSFFEERIKDFLKYTAKNNLRFVFTAITTENISDDLMSELNKHHYVLVEIE